MFSVEFSFTQSHFETLHFCRYEVTRSSFWYIHFDTCRDSDNNIKYIFRSSSFKLFHLQFSSERAVSKRGDTTNIYWKTETILKIIVHRSERIFLIGDQNTCHTRMIMMDVNVIRSFFIHVYEILYDQSNTKFAIVCQHFGIYRKVIREQPFFTELTELHTFILTSVNQPIYKQFHW